MLPWVGEGVTGSRRESLNILTDIAHKDSRLAKAVAHLTWFSDGVGENEVQALRQLLGLVSKDLELARITTTLSWFADEITPDENSALRALRELANVDADLAVEIVASSNRWSPQLVANSLRSLSYFRGQYQQVFNVLAAKAWFADGLNRQDAAFLSVLRGTLRWPELYDELMEEHYVTSTTIDAPLGGQVSIWLFSNKPIDPRDRLLDDFAQAIQTAEAFLMVPFPDREFLVLFADEPVPEVGIADRGIG